MTPAEKMAASKKHSLPREARVVCHLRAHRQAHGLSIRDVADAIGMSLSSFHALENGYHEPMLTNARKLAAFFGCTIDDLWPTTE